MTDLPEMDEEQLNPPPKKYSVSPRMKTIFLLGFLLGVSFYFYMIIERRILQNKYHMENQMAGVKLAPIVLPDLRVVDPKTQTLTELKPTDGRWLLINLWATWCPPCKEEMPSLELLHQKYGDKLDIVALSVDDNLAAVNEFISAHKPNFKVLWDKEQKAPDLFGVSKYPETFLISPQGVLSVQFSGQRDWAGASAVNYFAHLLQ